MPKHPIVEMFDNLAESLVNPEARQNSFEHYSNIVKGKDPTFPQGPPGMDTAGMVQQKFISKAGQLLKGVPENEIVKIINKFPVLTKAIKSLKNLTSNADKSALGEYKRSGRTIVLGEDPDLFTLFHELGHHVGEHEIGWRNPVVTKHQEPFADIFADTLLGRGKDVIQYSEPTGSNLYKIIDNYLMGGKR